METYFKLEIQSKNAFYLGQLPSDPYANQQRVQTANGDLQSRYLTRLFRAAAAEGAPKSL